MKVLALDSTAKSGSAAVLDGERALAVFTTDSGNTDANNNNGNGSGNTNQ